MWWKDVREAFGLWKDWKFLFCFFIFLFFYGKDWTIMTSRKEIGVELFTTKIYCNIAVYFKFNYFIYIYTYIYIYIYKVKTVCNFR